MASGSDRGNGKEDKRGWNKEDPRTDTEEVADQGQKETWKKDFTNYKEKAWEEGGKCTGRKEEKEERELWEKEKEICSLTHVANFGFTFFGERGRGLSLLLSLLLFSDSYCSLQLASLLFEFVPEIFIIVVVVVELVVTVIVCLLLSRPVLFFM